MKHLLSLILISSSFVLSNADIVTYEYDATGNRVLKVLMQTIEPKTIQEEEITKGNEMLKERGTVTLEYDGNRIVLTVPSDFVGDKTRIIICSLDGVVLKLVNPSDFVTEFDISDYIPECYIVIVEHDGESESWKLMKNP